MTDFKEMLESLSEENKKMLSYYGHWNQSPDERKQLSTTKADEYATVRNSLYQLFIFLKYPTDAEISAALSVDYSEPGFDFEGIKAPYKDNISALRTIRDEFRAKNTHEPDEMLIKVLLIHDLGKMLPFLTDYSLVDPQEASAAAHDLYVTQWLEGNGTTLREKSQTLSTWTNVFDGLGHNPQKIAEKGYVGLLTVVYQHMHKLAQLNEIHKGFPVDSQDFPGNALETLNAFLFDKAMSFGLKSNKYAFLIESPTSRQPWSKLPFEQQKQIVMILWCGPFIFVKSPFQPNEVTKEFITHWQRPANNKITTELTQFMIANMESKNDFLFLYNVTGLIHQKAEHGGSHFTEGGLVADFFTTFFPFILDIAGNKIPSITQKTGVVALNPFQVLQCVETSQDIFGLINNNTREGRFVECASPECKAEYFNRLKNDLEAKRSSTNRNSWHAQATIPEHQHSAMEAQMPVPH